MDARSLYVDDHHPITHQKTPDFTRRSVFKGRSASPVRYYYIDFGLSSYFRDGESPYVLNNKWACKKDPPEFLLPYGIPYNAFMLDVYMLGTMYQEEFLQVSVDDVPISAVC